MTTGRYYKGISVLPGGLGFVIPLGTVIFAWLMVVQSWGWEVSAGLDR